MTGGTDQTATDAAGGTERMLWAIRRVAAEVLLDAPNPPRALRLRAADVCLELEWPEPGQSGQAMSPHLESSGYGTGTARHDPAAHAAKQEPERNGAVVRAPMVGVFYRASQPGAAPFVTEGDHVTRGQQVGIIEAMKLMIPVEADWSGLITAVLVTDGHSVEYDQPLFAVNPDS